ncbi:MAG: diguanylate cyclase domain-containing protein [Halothiobacillaceae bacterium]
MRSGRLKSRILVLTGAMILFTSAMASLAFERVVDALVVEWGKRLTEIQVGYDGMRVLKVLERELALATQLARSESILAWARAPEDERLERAAIAELERYRENFRERNYFAALRENGGYYTNDAQNAYAGRQLRYYLDPDHPDHAWFYRLIELEWPFHIPVNEDAELGVTRLWIDVLLRDGDEVLGVVGTGLSLERFLKEFLEVERPGIASLFFDREGAIQLWRDARLIDFGSFVERNGQKRRLDLLIEDPAERARIGEAMRSLAESPETDGAPRIIMQFVHLEGTRQLAGIAYLPTVGWYQMTLVDLSTVLPASRFWGMGLVFLATLLLCLLLFNIAIDRMILRPVRQLEDGVTGFARGKVPRREDLPQTGDELARLGDHIRRMAGTIEAHTRELEDQVARRTAELDRLARIDPLTGLANRRGMEMHLAQVLARASRDGTTFGVIWIDLDHFKEINDRHGHPVGDAALVAVAGLLREVVRGYDLAARWGGDEFLAIMAPCDRESLEQVARRICTAVRSLAADAKSPDLTPAGLSVSVGATIGAAGESLAEVLARGDAALYAAKQGGRNGYRLILPSHDGI